MMKKIFTMAALAFLMTACSNDIDEPQAQQQPANSDGMITITAKLAPKSEAGTRAVAPGTDSNGKDIIKVKWAVDEHLAILYEVNSTKYEADARISYVDANTGIATITFSVVEGTADNTACTIVYPKSAAKEDHSGVKDAATLLAAQDGTLKDDLDVRVGAGNIIATTPNLIVTTQPVAQFAIHKFTIQDLSAADKTATEFKVSDASGNVITTVTPGSATGTLYVALPVMAAGTYWFNATIDSKPYINKATTTAATTAGTYYQSTVKMATLGDLMGADSKFYASSDAITAASTTAIGVIAYLGTDNFTEEGTDVGGSPFVGHGLVLCLKNAASNVKWSTEFVSKFAGQKVTNVDGLKRTDNVSGYSNTAVLTVDAATAAKYPAAAAAKGYAGLTAPTGTTGWFLPSAQQLLRIIQTPGLGGLADGAPIFASSWFDNQHVGVNNIQAALAKAGTIDVDYDSMIPYLWYWSSSECSSSCAVRLDVDATSTGTGYGFHWFDGNKDISTGNYRVRPVLAF